MQSQTSFSLHAQGLCQCADRVLFSTKAKLDKGPVLVYLLMYKSYTVYSSGTSYLLSIKVIACLDVLQLAHGTVAVGSNW